MTRTATLCQHSGSNGVLKRLTWAAVAVLTVATVAIAVGGEEVNRHRGQEKRLEETGVQDTYLPDFLK